MAKSPFSISPNPQSLFITPTLKATAHKIKYVIDNRQGLTCMLGDVGLGKSSLLRLIYSEYASSEDTNASLITTPVISSDFAFLKNICSEFELPPRRSVLDQLDTLKDFLVGQYEQGKNVAVFIDEAQMLQGKQLEQIRTLLNFETNHAKLIQIVLAGQLELRDKLRDKSKKAVRSRIVFYSLLDPLTLGETRQMIEFRCQQAEIQNPFPEATLEEIYNQSLGVPREVLKICAAAYEFMKIQGESTCSPETLEIAVNEAVLA